jgi:hypothetical protein
MGGRDRRFRARTTLNDSAPYGSAIASRRRFAHLVPMRILDVDQVAPSEAIALTEHLIEDEPIHVAFVSATGLILFTELRILTVQREHLLDERIETSSYPYRELRHFSLAEAPSGSARTAIRIWLGAEPQPLQLRANPGTGFVGLQRLLAAKIG